MKLLKVIAFSVLFILTTQKAKAMDARSQVFLTVTGYGVAAGTLLGTASLAFGARPRSIAVGASLGLYAGIIFGTYIIVSHAYSKQNPDLRQYPDTNYGPYSGDLASPRGESLYRYEHPKAFDNDKVQEKGHSYYMNLFNLTF